LVEKLRISEKRQKLSNFLKFHQNSNKTSKTDEIVILGKNSLKPLKNA